MHELLFLLYTIPTRDRGAHKAKERKSSILIDCTRLILINTGMNPEVSGPKA